ncbi:Transmembrane receptor eukaryota [Fasciolopsis buskii]|uniref:Transmembrane receptor eukaryota n=1 Tax=Fasciolopsis buskii TaxID=27845 RepID=A0A8E0RQI0_9TREM|nr:Transmembrane receptor eukaryota [Fasciolopsis buski]
MVIFYLVFVLIWLVWTIMYWHTLMRIQFYIGLVLLLGLWEHFTLIAIYGNLQTMGTVSPSAVYFAELIACVKRTLARLLVLIACLGYGVTIPRLGKIWFRRCLAIGSVYFILVTMEGMARVHNPRFHTTQFVLATLFPLMCLDAAIMWWIFVYLARTLRETRLRHSLIKHNLYRNFSYVLVIVSLVSVVFMVWSIMAFKRHFCIRNWHLLWIDDAFWQILFLIIMAVIIVMWRPTDSNREYAYSLLDGPLMDANEDENDIILENLTAADGK